MFSIIMLYFLACTFILHFCTAYSMLFIFLVAYVYHSACLLHFCVQYVYVCLLFYYIYSVKSSLELMFLFVITMPNQNKVFYVYVYVRVITKLPNTEQSSKGKVKTHKSINRKNQSTTGKLGKPQWPWLGTGISYISVSRIL